MKKIIPVCSLVFLVIVVVYNVDLAVQLALCKTVSSEVYGLARMSVEDLSDIGFLCLAAWVSLLLVRESNLPRNFFLFFLASVIWAIGVRSMESHILPIIEPIIVKTSSKRWLFVLHCFFVFPFTVAFYFALKDLYARLLRRGGDCVKDFPCIILGPICLLVCCLLMAVGVALVRVSRGAGV